MAIKSPHNTALIIIFFAIIGTVVALFYIMQVYSNPSGDAQTTDAQNSVATHETTDSSSGYSASTTSPPKVLLLPVPMTAQAPSGNWDQLHNEACEEANAIMADAYFTSHGNLDPKYVESEITKLTDWQDQNFGYHLDTTAAETAKMIEQVYGLKTNLVNNFTADDLKQALLKNQLIIISENGRLLNNPNYKRPGPIHHMLLVKGYNAAVFITNDSGTKRGLNYFYTFDTLKTAAADWDHDTNTVNENKKVAIVVGK